MKVVFVNRFFHPDISATSQLLADLAFHLAGQFEVHVVASRQKYEQPREWLPATESVRGVQVHRVWTTRFGRDWLPGRALDYLTFYFSASLKLLSVLRRGDVVVALTDPPVISVAAAAVAWLKQAPLVNWVQDVFPETAAALGMRIFQGAPGRVLGWFRDRSLLAASANVALGERMASRIVSRGVPPGRVRVIHNWSPGAEIRPMPPELNPLRRKWDLDGRFVVGYSGNMGRAHDLEVLLHAAEQLRHRKEISFLFIGAGIQRDALASLARSRALDNVMFQPYQPRELLPQSLTAPDCHVVSLRPELEGLVFPSKLYSSLAAGRPVIFLGARDSEICQMMQSAEPFGICIGTDDAAGLVQAILSMCDNPGDKMRMGENGRRLFEQRFDLPIALANWSDLLARL